MKRVFLILSLILNTSVFAAAQYRSVYTDLAESKCKTLESFPDEGGSYIGECRGIAGYKLNLLEGDLRQSINVISPTGRKFELNFWNASGGFSSVGPKAEWRMNGKTPIALIVRYNVSEDPDDTSKVTSYLTVSKIGSALSCLTNIIGPGKNQNAVARRIADTSARRECRPAK